MNAPEVQPGLILVDEPPEMQVSVVVVGAGACGLVAALAARDAGVDVLVLERDAVPRGSTALSSGLIPAAGTRWQQQAGVEDTPQKMTIDIQNKNDHQADLLIVDWVSQRSASTLHWLADQHGVPFSLVTGFLYPGHSLLRMHGTPRRTGDELMGALTNAAERVGVDIVCQATVTALLVTNSRRVCGVELKRPDGTTERIGCEALVLASSGFGGNADLVKQYMPAMTGAVYYGHAGNQGDALKWGTALGAQVSDVGAYQGHGSLAWPHQTLITWSVMMMGGIQVNRLGKRFSNEHEGYSEQARRVIAQPDGVAWDVFDDRIHEAAMGFEDYRQAHVSGAVLHAQTIDELAQSMDVPSSALNNTLAEVRALAQEGGNDRFGRTFSADDCLVAPYRAIRVTGALFHTQGGLAVDKHARVLGQDAEPIVGLYAGGGAARGLSGSGDSGYLSGNGLLAAVMLGATAGESAAAQVLQRSD